MRAEADKHNVVVSVENGVNFGIVSPTSLPITKKLTIITTVDQAVHLRRIWRTTSPKTGSPFRIDSLKRTLCTLDRALQIEVTFDPKDQAGILEERIDLRLGIESPTREFIISRTLRANVGDPELYAEFKPKTPYAPKVIHRPIAETEPKEVDVVDGPKPPDMVAAQWARKLPRYDIPSEVAKANVDDPSLPFGERRKRAKTLMPDAFSVATHGKFFHRLLHFEEVQERCACRHVDGFEHSDDRIGPTCAATIAKTSLSPRASLLAAVLSSSSSV